MLRVFSRTSKEQQKQQYPMGNSDDEDDIGFPMFEAENSSPMVATLTFLGGLGLLAAGGYFFKDQVGYDGER